MGFLFLLLMMAVATAVGYGYAEDKQEDALLLKLFGYSVLGFLTLAINGLPLPLGYAFSFWLSSRVERNQMARRAAATTAFILWLIGLLLF